MKKITFIGTGYVGLVGGAGISEFGHSVTCADIDQNKIARLQEGEIPIYEPGLESLVKQNVAKGRLHFSDNVPESIQNADIIFIAVGTPQGSNGEANLSAIESVAKTIGENLNGYKIVCTKSTVPIGTGKRIEEIIRSINPNSDFDYVSNPEFLREGAAVKDFLHPDRVIIGTRTQKAIDVMGEVYRPLYINETPIISTSVETAEMIKYAANAFLSLKISYINEIANLCEAVGADVHEVARAMGLDGRISAKFLHPGPGYGGSCFPKDTHALAATGQKYSSPLYTVEAAIKTNASQKVRMVDKLQRLMDGSFKGKTVAVLGLAFKPQTDDVREAASRVIVSQLVDSGTTVHAYDPIAMDNFKIHFPDIQYFDSWQDAVKNAHACILLTEWNEFRGMDLNELKDLMKRPVILDTKNILSIHGLESSGFTYDNVGRKLHL
ncbi:MAG: UDP-glucose/GDP-mannose dehydrogenase family protein [Candidatus Marinimicrobia bacterium]|nr:UDP-glucose/GDP-mannose dehydrogenase family protein [Candidatus Neomarinimicrobiota bacterium]MBL7010154.1 UDP-glucose/GDP-mannose dehydrogenase family protein [Candidatus Neomarinimicrobiota bacterium]MBL7030419.1 UDP-glucose/GDP-mannose dehydrogenase family protein [Candidatus Neomarinimicrobiota bacterium]